MKERAQQIAAQAPLPNAEQLARLRALFSLPAPGTKATRPPVCQVRRSHELPRLHQ